MKYTEKHWTGLKRSKTFDFLLESAILICNSQQQQKSPMGDQHWDYNDGSWEGIYGKARNLYCDPRAIRDQELIKFYSNYSRNILESSNDINLQKKLNTNIKAWLKDYYKLNTFDCLPQVSTQNTIIDFCLQNKNRNIIMHQEEYWQTQWFDSMNIKTTKTKKIVDAIDENSALILDLPLRGTMELPTWTDEVFDLCDKLQVPVLLDTAYLLLQDNPLVDFDRKCITHICCALSKTFSFNGMSLGFKFKKTNLVSKYDLYYAQNRPNVQIILDLIENFSCRYIFDKYAPLRSKWCKILNLQATSSVKHAHIPKELQWFNASKFWYDNGLSQNLIDLTVLYENDAMLTNYWSL